MRYKSQPIAVLILSLFLLSIIAYWGCESSGTDPDDGAQGNLLIEITDDPLPLSIISRTNVTIGKIELRRDSTNGQTPFITISEDEKTYNLLELRNGVTEILADVEIPAGAYDLIRLYVSEAEVQLQSGQTFNLSVPSGAQSGVKLFVNPAIEVFEGLTAELLLDFDLSRSFVALGNPFLPGGLRGFKFRPVIRAINIATAGRIIGTVRDTASNALSFAEVWAEQDSVISTTFTNPNGGYALLGLKEGHYSLFATKSNYDTAKVESVKVIAGNRTTVDFDLKPLSND